jgi:hypothetical protein
VTAVKPSGLASLAAGVKDLGATAGPALAKLIGPLKEFAVSVAPPLIKTGREIGTVLGGAFSSIGDIISTKLAPAFAAFLPAIAPLVRFLLTILGSAVVGALKGVVKVVEGVLTILAGLFNVVAGLLTGDWSRLWEGIKQILSGAWKAILGIVQVALNVGVLKLVRGGLLAVKLLFTSGVKLFIGAWRLGLDLIPRLMNSALSLTGRLALAGIKGLGGLFAKLPGLILRGVGSVGRLLVGKGRDVLTGMRAGATTGFATVRTFVAGIPGKIRSAVGNLGRLLYDAGTRVIQGLIDGITSRLAALRETIAGAAQIVRDHWPFSPARAGPLRRYPMDKAGRNVVDQLTGGMRSRLGSVAATAGAMAGLLAVPVQPAPAAATAGGGGVTRLHPDDIAALADALTQRPIRLSTGELVSGLDRHYGRYSG